MILLCSRYLKQSAATFFGLDESKESELRQRWEERRRRLAERRCGTLRESCEIVRRIAPVRTPPEAIDSQCPFSTAAGRRRGRGRRRQHPAGERRIDG